MSQTPTPTATLTIMVSMPLSESSAAVSRPSDAAAPTSRIAAARWKASAIDGNVSCDAKYSVDHTTFDAARHPRAIAISAHGRVRGGW